MAEIGAKPALLKDNLKTLAESKLVTSSRLLELVISLLSVSSTEAPSGAAEVRFARGKKGRPTLWARRRRNDL
jgi:hypothetical protein